MNQRFRDRTDAGRQLAARLEACAALPRLLVLALPRGGVPVACEIASRLRAPLEVLNVRKLGLPGAEEIAMGALGPGGIRVLNHGILEEWDVPPHVVAQVAAREARELARREAAFRGSRPPPALRGASVIVVDDGIATGATMRAALAAVHAAGAARVIVAVPVIARECYLELHGKAEDIVALQMPKVFRSVGAWYDEFPQVSDSEVRRLLAEHAGPARARDLIRR